MSANIVSMKQILLIASIYHEETTTNYKLDLSSIWYIEQTANELYFQNTQSFNFRYPDDKQEPYKFNLKESWDTVDLYRGWLNEFSAIEKIKLVQNYVYNSDNHPEWEFSRANKICQSCMSKLISQLGGWEQAPWGIA